MKNFRSLKKKKTKKTTTTIKLSCQNYTDALNADNAALLKALIFVSRSLRGRLFQVTIVLGNHCYREYHCYKKLAERDDDLEVGIFFSEGTLQGGSLGQRSLGGSCRTYTTGQVVYAVQVCPILNC